MLRQVIVNTDNFGLSACDTTERRAEAVAQ